MRASQVLDASSSRLWTAYVRRRFPNVEIGHDVALHGFPVLKVAESATLSIGDRVTLTSRPRSNPVGLSRRCSIALEPGATLSIGPDSGFSGVAIFCGRSITIGAFVLCGGNVSIWDTDFHPLEPMARRRHALEEIRTAAIVIDDDVFIGSNSVILKGVHIGSGAVIGAGSVVTRDVPAYSVWAGNPAREIRREAVDTRA